MERGVNNRLAQVERSINTVEEVLAAMKLEQQQRLASFQVEQDHRFTKLEQLLTSFAHGTAPSDEAEASTHLFVLLLLLTILPWR